jgi:hypothetical protein
MSVRFSTLGLGQSALVLSIAFGFVGCDSDGTGADPGLRAHRGAWTSHSSEQVWGERDDPSLFTADLEYGIDALPRTGEVSQIPWAGSYWPVYQDSINVKWDGADSLSPAAKYGAAFGVEDAEDAVSASNGIDSANWRDSCTTSSQCDSAQGETCAMRDGEDSGYCIPTWWGICHAWAPASILEMEPVNPVTRNGVTFEVNDIKALVSIAYNSTDTRFVSLRCNETDALDEIEYDAYNRPTDADEECRDTNAGTYHVLLTNYLGLMDQSFVEDRTFDSEVWNQPLRGYRVTEMEEVSAHDALVLLDVIEPSTISSTLQQGEWEEIGTRDVVPGDTFSANMTGTDGDADLYVRFDGTPTSTDYDCRPYSSGSDETCELTVPSEASQVTVSVYAYSGTPSVEVTLDDSADADSEEADAYLFNPDAERFYSVALEVDYIGESPTSLDGNLSASIDSYTYIDSYRYILEVDGHDEIVGGEWIGESKTAHPDFLWLPIQRNESAEIAEGAIEFANVRDLLDESLVASSGDASSAETVGLTDSASVDAGDWVEYGPFEIDSGVLTMTLSGSGDADLYVRESEAPTASSYDCRPYTASSDETCTVSGPGTFYVSVNGYTASDYALEVSWDAEEEEEASSSGDNVLTDSVELDEMAVYSVAISEGETLLVETEASNDIDLYLQMGSAPTTSEYDDRGYTVSGNESLTTTASADDTLYIGVHGYEASAFTLTVTVQ